jgi:hypothetical protein
MTRITMDLPLSVSWIGADQKIDFTFESEPISHLEPIWLPMDETDAEVACKTLELIKEFCPGAIKKEMIAYTIWLPTKESNAEIAHKTLALIEKFCQNAAEFFNEGKFSPRDREAEQRLTAEQLQDYETKFAQIIRSIDDEELPAKKVQTEQPQQTSARIQRAWRKQFYSDQTLKRICAQLWTNDSETATCVYPTKDQITTSHALVRHLSEKKIEIPLPPPPLPQPSQPPQPSPPPPQPRAPPQPHRPRPPTQSEQSKHWQPPPPPVKYLPTQTEGWYQSDYYYPETAISGVIYIVTYGM